MTHPHRTINRHFGQVSRPMRWICRALLRVMGWKSAGVFPEDPRLVAIFAPHTSNWDFVIIILMVTARGIKGNFFAKHTLCRPPLGWFMRAVGAIPVVRRRTEHLVDSAVEALAGHERFYLGLAPEGTRRYTDHWRTGFYHIAERSGARIVLMYADYAKKETGFGPVIAPTGDMERDFEAIRTFYEDKTPKRPENRSDAVLGKPRGGVPE
jgi:1-acyl-sn-glycerol-3-phosphate acyltransferase